MIERGEARYVLVPKRVQGTCPRALAAESQGGKRNRLIVFVNSAPTSTSLSLTAGLLSTRHRRDGVV